MFLTKYKTVASYVLRVTGYGLY